MPASPTLVIRNGTIMDGSGGDPFEADVTIADGLITAIGRSSAAGTRKSTPKGKLVTPGFVDVHTHYDAQATWSSRLSPSSWNGVTTLLFGNCGVGFAPCHPRPARMLVKLMEGVEDIPEVVLTEGLPWNWHSFPEFLDALDRRPLRRGYRRAGVRTPPCGSMSWASAAPTGNRQPNRTASAWQS